MGSYLTVVNDTPNNWQCKVGPDMLALKVSGIIVSVIAAAMAILSITGAALSLVAIKSLPVIALTSIATIVGLPFAAVATATGAIVYGLPMLALASALTYAISVPSAILVGASGIAVASVASGAAAGVSAIGAVGAGVTGTTAFGIAVVEAVMKKLNHKGYDTIMAGGKRRYGRMTLSLWQQSVCMRTTTKGPKVEIDTIYMRPIFSGPTINSNRDHNIQYWINKHGITTKYSIEGRSKHKTRTLEEQIEYSYIHSK